MQNRGRQHPVFGKIGAGPVIGRLRRVDVAQDDGVNVFEKLVEAAEAGATHGEICAKLRDEFGFGQPLVAA